MKQFWLPLAAGIACLATSGAWAQDVTLRVWDSYTEKADQFDAIIAAFEEFDRRARRLDGATMRQYEIDHIDWRHKAAAFGVGP